MEKQTITIYDVAREANVSMATVSRVVNGNPNVKPATRKKVLDVIDRLDYRPNAVARGLASKKTTTIGVIIPDVSNMFFSSLARGIDDIATMYKYNIILANSDGDSNKEVQVLNNLLAKQVDGIIFMGHRITEEVRGEFSRSKTPVVLAGSIDPDEQVGSVNIDYTKATKEAVSLLAKNGHEKIAFVSGALIDAINGQNRLNGYKEGLKENNLEYNEGMIFEAPYEFKEGLALVDRILNSGATAAYITDDELAIGVLDGLYDAGVKVPEDFEIITSNNTLLTDVTRPRLSSVTQPLYDIGAVATRLLTKLMNKEEIEQKTIVLPSSIMEKGSTK
ncbi:catabolite control protein A [Tetragenococcus halophilus]|uniref:Catabolite control protein A n=1 Tax=Tetragenococcus halophilus (strain DSM 20338 / JCM 20259 / NCIMB 9735 / NBRC 12172) TaxID=945021 RepID=A0AAN1VRG2_TETHN|nr:catabolite control protein A [Tetragenococcus halophilus]NRR75455.1 catabolite control protein A [Tetragenococcus halophilus]BAK95043.1 catabolite control protein A [Tetragenococcus halophilus NBRC 12172]GBD70975.1 catabolite control protein A [Tetragenococcus halophilus subsp. halophilus]GBD79045.1 catabolite control protein A [Tetragenococcus halophilus subsp. halophilus]GFK29189.1 catabolite control protein A [Tetragenococcus halophilus]